MPEPRTRPRCPICGALPRPDSLPFCSKRCAQVDLGRWFTGQYVLPGPPAEEDEDGGPLQDEDAGE